MPSGPALPPRRREAAFAFGPLLWILFFVAIGPRVYLDFLPHRRARCCTTREKACYCNIRCIQGAIEQYNMDHASMLDTVDLAALQRGQYLKTIPRCPGNDRPDGPRRQFLEFWMGYNYREIVPEPFYSIPPGDYRGSNLIGDGIVSCTLHESIE